MAFLWNLLNGPVIRAGCRLPFQACEVYPDNQDRQIK
jgi:hypothetical protein